MPRRSAACNARQDLWGGARYVQALQMASYRYFRFFNDGSVLYSLTHAPPPAMAKLLKEPRGARQPPGQPKEQQPKAQYRRLSSACAVVAALAKAAPPRGDLREAPDVVAGTYSLHAATVYVAVRSHYNVVNFNLELTHGRRGHFCRLEVLDHFSRGLTPGALPSGHAETVGHAFWFFRAYARS